MRRSIRKITRKFSLTTTSLMVIMGFLLGSFFWPDQSAGAVSYIDPLGPPVTGTFSDNTKQFLLGAPSDQHKTGSLLIGEKNGRVPNCTTADTSGCSKICLASNPDNGLTDINCISSWSEVTKIIGNFLRLQSAANPVTTDLGYVGWRPNNALSQVYGLIVQSNQISNKGAIRGRTFVNTQYALLTSGRILIQRKNSEGVPLNDAELCLNGSTLYTAPGVPFQCITAWNQAVASTPADIITLQTSSNYNADSGGAIINGPVVFNDSTRAGQGSIVIGRPIGINRSYTCGDGLCEIESGEATSNCSNDCPN